MNTDLLTIKDVSKKLGVAPRVVYRFIDARILPSVVASRITFVPADAIRGLAFTDEELIALVREKKNRLSASSQGSDSHGQAARR
jgi:hypothetical protein